ncbi:MAG: 4Fe-4S binding protein [Clostridiales Family XIII bacterium]|jgi:Fe-S-cluster-containing hydrogenase component 2|nr:4Fe-4S binding protein [Clostridiales Family XIII bacterium]
MSVENEGYLTIEELKAAGQYPSGARFQEGPVAVIECVQEIPCNPCETACRFGAIRVGEPITNLPKADEGKCTGCGLCVARCPGLAIFIVDKTYGEGLGAVSFPYEYFPLPSEGDEVTAVDRAGRGVCAGTVVKILAPESFDRTPVVTVAVPVGKAEDVRGIERAGQAGGQS